MFLAIDIFATLAFAISGALVASRKEMDAIGFVWLAILTGIGGGTVRDLLLGVPVFWVNNSLSLMVCVVAATGIYFTAHLVGSRHRWVLWMDAVGLSLVTIAGTSKAIELGVGPVVAVAMGIVTGSVGGIIRDLIGQEPSIILRREIYVTASMSGAIAYVAILGVTNHSYVATGCGLMIVFLVRGLAILKGWSLPTYKARPPREIT